MTGATVSAVEAGSGRLHVLGLPAVAVRRHHHPPGDGVGHPAPVLLADQVQAGIDAGGGAGAGDDRIGVHVEHGSIDVRGREQERQLGRAAPVGRAPPPVQQPGRPEHERAGADAEYPPAARDRAPQCLKQRLGIAVPAQPGMGLGDGRHRHQVGLVKAVHAERGIEGEPHRGTQWPRLPRDHREVVAGQAIARPVGPEDLTHHTQLERLESVEHHYRDVTEHAAIMPRRWQDVMLTCHHCHFHCPGRWAMLGVMTSTDRASAPMWRAACRAARRVADVVAECNYAQRRLLELRLDPERYVLDGDRAPASYQEFVLRSSSSGMRWREPSSGERTAGAPVCPVASRNAPKR